MHWTFPVDSPWSTPTTQRGKTGPAILHKTQILPIQPNLWLHLNPKYEQHFEKKKKSIKTFDLRMKSSFKESNALEMHQGILGLLKKTEVIFWMNSLKQKPIPVLIRRNFHNILQHHPKHLYVFKEVSRHWQNGLHSCSKLNNYQEISSNKKLHLHSISLCNRTSSHHHLALGLTIIKQ